MVVDVPVQTGIVSPNGMAQNMRVGNGKDMCLQVASRSVGDLGAKCTASMCIAVTHRAEDSPRLSYGV